MQLPKEEMFDKKGQWVHLETYDDFDNGFTALTDLWFSTSDTVSQAVKESALQHFKDDLEAAVLQWEGNRAKSKKYASISEELAEFEAVLKEEAEMLAQAATPVTAKPKAKKKA